MAKSAGPDTLGVDIGGTKMEWACVRAGKVVDEGVEPTGPKTTGPDLMGALGRLRTRCAPRSVAVSVAGMVQRDRIERLPNLPLVQPMALGEGVRVENDAKCAALAHWVAGGKRTDECFCTLMLGTGMGVGWVDGGRLVRGASNRAGEFGHIRVRTEDRAVAQAEELCGGAGIERRLQRIVRGTASLSGAKYRGMDAKAILASGGTLEKRVAREAARELGWRLADLSLAADPARIVIGGSVGRALMERFAQEVRASFSEQGGWESCRLEISKIRNPSLAGALILGSAGRDKAILSFLGQ